MKQPHFLQVMVGLNRNGQARQIASRSWLSERVSDSDKAATCLSSEG